MWEQPVIDVDNMLPIDGYNVYWDAGYLLSGNFVLKERLNSYDQFSYAADGLTAGTLYKFQVSARNAVGEGPLSDEVQSYAQSLPAKPEAPYRVSS